MTLTAPQDCLTRGDYDYEQNDLDKAIADYSHAIDLNPSLSEAYNNRAYVHMIKKKYASALADLDSAIEIQHGYVNALMNCGDIYSFYHSINYECAVGDYDRVLQIDPSAASNTSVCGHRMLAMKHGWNLSSLTAAQRQTVAAVWQCYPPVNADNRRTIGYRNSLTGHPKSWLHWN